MSGSLLSPVPPPPPQYVPPWAHLPPHGEVARLLHDLLELLVDLDAGEKKKGGGAGQSGGETGRAWRISMGHRGSLDN